MDDDSIPGLDDVAEAELAQHAKQAGGEEGADDDGEEQRRQGFLVRHLVEQGV